MHDNASIHGLKNNRIKILMFTDNLICGGKERRLLSLIKGLKVMPEYSVELAIVDNDIFYDINDLKVNLHVLDRSVRWDPWVFIKFIKLCKLIEPDLIHSWGSMPAIYAIPAARLLNIKLFNSEITTIRTSKKIVSEIRRLITFKFSDLIAGNSIKGLRSYDTPGYKSVYIPNGFDFSRLNKIKSKKFLLGKYQINTPKIVGMVAVLNYKKDHITFLIAAMEILKQRNDVSFLVAGKGDRLNAYKLMTKEFDKIIYTGPVKNIESVISIFDIGVLTTNSPQYEEGLSNAIIEYMALGKPVLATNSGGTPELVIDGYNGFLLKPKDPNELINKINYLLDNEPVCNAMGKTGKDIIRNKFSVELMTRLTVQAYKDLLNGKDNNSPLKFDLNSGALYTRHETSATMGN